MIEYWSKNFAILSAIVFVAASALTMAALSSYLAVFDWNLIWLIEYTDLFKLFLILTALISGVVSITTSNLVDFSSLHDMSKWHRITSLALIICLPLVNFLSNIYGDINHPATSAKFYHVTLLISSFVAIYITYRIARLMQQGFAGFTALDYLKGLSAIVSAAILFGSTYGYHVKDASSSEYKVWTHNRVLDRARAVIITSHHVIFFVQDVTIVLPTADVIQITTLPTGGQSPHPELIAPPI